MSSELSSCKILQDLTLCAAKAKEEEQRSTEFYLSEEFNEHLLFYYTSDSSLFPQ